MTQSARLGLSMIEPGQIEKSATHNEALASIDVALCAAVDGVLVSVPPGSPAVGDCYILGNAPTGVWAGHGKALAGYTAGGWRFIEAFDGLTVTDKATGQAVIYRGGSWETGHVQASKLSIAGQQVVGPKQSAVPDPTGGTTVDAEARSAIAGILQRLRAHGLIES